MTIMEIIKSKRPSRPAPRLRTKTGCHKCRERRKKCDEKKPICGACAKLHLHCSYRESSSQPRQPSEGPTSLATRLESEYNVVDLVPLSTLYPTVSLISSTLKTERDWRVFQYAATRFIQLLTTPDATAEFRDVSSIYAIGFHEPWVMHAALAPAALHASCAALMPREDAMMYTDSALRGLRKAIERSEPNAETQETFLVASLFMGVFEDFYSAPESQCLTHYKEIARVLESQTAKTGRLDIDQLSVFQRALLDSVLYHFATRLIFEEDVDCICESFPSQTIAMYIDVLENATQLPPESCPILPVIGRCKPSLFLLIYQITWLSRQVPLGLDSYNHPLALHCLDELDKLSYSSPIPASDNMATSPNSASMTLSNSDVSAKLYFLATKIFLSKVLDPVQVCTTSPEIFTMVKRASELLRLYDGAAPCGQFICWAILILGCAACPINRIEARADFTMDIGAASRLEMRSLIQHQLLLIWNTSYSGYVRRTASALEKIWSLPTFLARSLDLECEAEVEYDGLNALVFYGGLGQTLLSLPIP